MADHKILALKRWERCEYRPDGDTGGTISMELRRVKRHEVKPLRIAFAEALVELERGRDQTLTAPQKAAILANVFEKVGEQDLAQLFEENVRDVQGLSMDGEHVNTGAGLLEVANDDLVFFVIMSLNRLSNLTSAESFHFASPSTSSAEAPEAPASSSADAARTESEASPKPSTATEQPTSHESSFAVEL